MKSLSRHLSERNIPKLYIPVISVVSLECKIKLQNNNIYVSKISVAKSDRKTNRRDIPKNCLFPRYLSKGHLLCRVRSQGK